MLVAYNFDSYSIHVKPLKSQHDNDMIKAYKEIYTKLSSQGLKPKLHWLDNEASKALKSFHHPGTNTIPTYTTTYSQMQRG